MLGYVKHKKSLVSKGKKKSSSSPLVPVKVVTIAPVVPPPPSLPVSTDDQLRSYMTSVLADLLSKSGQIETNLPLFRTKNLPSFINNRLSSRSSECTAARFKYPANRPGGGGRYSLPLRAVSSPRHSPLSSQPEWTCVA